MKLVKLLIIFVLITLITLPAFSEEKKITVYVGENFKIELASNMSTGYRWQLAKPLDKNVIELVSSDYFRSNTPLIGAGGKEVWVFKAVKCGETDIELFYLRPWESKQPEDKNVYRVKVVK